MNFFRLLAIVIVAMPVSRPHAQAEGACLRVSPLPDGGKSDVTVTSASGIDWRCDSELTNAELVARRRAQAKAAAEGEQFTQRTKQATAVCKTACRSGNGTSNAFSGSTSASCTCSGAALSAADCSSFCAASELPFDSLSPSTGSTVTNFCGCKAHE